MNANYSYNFDFKKLVNVVKKRLKQYIIIVVASVIIGLIVAFSIPKSYTTKVKLIPETPPNGVLSGNLNSLTSLMGLNVNGMSSDAIFPEIYPEVIRSTTFLLDIAKIRVETADKSLSTSYYDYIANYQKSPWWNFLFRLFDSNKDTTNVNNLNTFKLDKNQAGVMDAINGSINCSENKDDGIITICVTTQDPLISAVMADSVMVRLQDYITEYRTNKARNDFDNIEKMYKEAKANYEKARRKYSSFADRNQDLIMQSYRSSQDELENEMQLQYNIYTQVSTQLQLAKAKIIEKTPVYAVLQPATIPYRHSAPKKSLIILAFIAVGCFGYTLYLMYRIS